jgi:hypothetical protein
MLRQHNWSKKASTDTKPAELEQQAKISTNTNLTRLYQFVSTPW